MKRSIKIFKEYKKQNKKIAMTTCYDSAFAKIIKDCDIDAVLIGDSLGNVMLGHDNTLNVSVGDIIYHAKSVSNIIKNKFLIADLPFGSFINKDIGLKNAVKIIKKTCVQAVKIEGGLHIVEHIKEITKFGIPVMGHIGFTPQYINQIGGYIKQGTQNNTKETILKSAIEIEKAGAFAIVLEMMSDNLTKQIKEKLKIPVIGIGSGIHCDGQILVLHDMIGMNKDFNPKFLKKYLNLHDMILNALNKYSQEVKDMKYPKDL